MTTEQRSPSTSTLFGKLSPTNGGAIRVYSRALKGTTIMGRLLLSDGKTLYEGPLRITNGDSPFINAPKPYVHGWITACGRNGPDLHGKANVRNSVYAFTAGGFTILHFAEFADGITTLGSGSPSPNQREEIRRTRHRDHSLARNDPEGTRSLCGPSLIEHLRQSNWGTIPDITGVYWWYFPQSRLESLGIALHCDSERLRLRRAGNGKLCLYVGIAENLRKRIKWHSAQRLSQSTLQSGWLSTLRLSLLALAKLDYDSGDAEINRLMDELDVAWTSTQDEREAKAIESSELCGGFHFPLNIRDNHRLETARFVKHLRERRKAYRKQYLP